MSRTAKLSFAIVFLLLGTLAVSGYIMLACPPPPTPTPVTITIAPPTLVLNCNASVADPTGTVTISVTDATGSPVVGVPLTITFSRNPCVTANPASGTSSAVIGQRGRLTVTLTGLCEAKPCTTVMTVTAGGTYTGTATATISVK
jgi:hypothetical protein